MKVRGRGEGGSEVGIHPCVAVPALLFFVAFSSPSFSIYFALSNVFSFSTTYFGSSRRGILASGRAYGSVTTGGGKSFFLKTERSCGNDVSSMPNMFRRDCPSGSYQIMWTSQAGYASFGHFYLFGLCCASETVCQRRAAIG